MTKAFWEGFWFGTKQAFAWYFEAMAENKWMIILFVLDMILIPVKLVVVPTAMLFQKSRAYIVETFFDLVEK